MTYFKLRSKCRSLWPSHLPNYRKNRRSWLIAVARLGDRWILSEAMRIKAGAL